MEAQLEEIREQQRATWNKFSHGWQKWNDLTMDWLQPMGDEIIQKLELRENDVVLDVAAGTGEPGLTIAASVKNGQVIVTDLAENMLAIARENAMERGLHNVETIACDVCALPFPDNMFDAVSCRFGFMFFPDMQLAAKEMMRVLKPGGRLATSVWSAPEHNFWISAIMNTINKYMPLPPTPAGAPSMFRCAAPGFIAHLFEQAGLHNVSETEVHAKLNVLTTNGYWIFMNEVAAPVAAALSKVDESLLAKIKTDVYELVHQQYPEGEVAIDSAALIIYGQK